MALNDTSFLDLNILVYALATRILRDLTSHKHAGTPGTV